MVNTWDEPQKKLFPMKVVKQGVPLFRLRSDGSLEGDPEALEAALKDLKMYEPGITGNIAETVMWIILRMLKDQEARESKEK
jgi:hypothetical protein